MNSFDHEAKYNHLWGSIREITLAEKIYSKLPKKFNTLVDVGCGDGFFLHYIHKKNSKKKYYGLDISAIRLKNTQKNLPSIKLIKSNIEHIDFPDNYFDIVVCSEVLEHVENYEKSLQELIRITGKKLVITVPNNQELVEIICPNCRLKHYLAGHINRFDKRFFVNLIHRYKNVKVRYASPFYTIYSYNKLTLKLPLIVRLFLDYFLVRLSKFISFFKGNYLIFVIEKQTSTE